MVAYPSKPLSLTPLFENKLSLRTFTSIFTIKKRNFQFGKGSQIGVTIIISSEIEIKIFHCFLVILTTVKTALGT